MRHKISKEEERMFIVDLQIDKYGYIMIYLITMLPMLYNSLKKIFNDIIQFPFIVISIRLQL